MIGYVMLSSSRRIAVLLASALLAGPVRPALAQPASPKNQKAASELVKRAIAKGEAGDHNAAIKLYNEAYDLAPNSLLLSNIGAQYQELGEWEDALNYFCQYLKEDPGGVNAAFARSQAKIVQRQLGRRKVDSKDPCAAPPGPNPTSPGGGALSIKPPDDDTTDRVRPTDDSPGPRRSGRSRSNPGSELVEPDGGPGTVKPTSTAPGPKPLTDEPAARTIGGNPVLMYTGLAAGIAGIAAGGIGVYYGIQGKSINDLINSHPKDTPWQDDIRAKMSEGERDNRLQVTYLVASGVLVAAGVVLYVVGRPDAPEHASDRTVRVVPTANGAAVFGRF
jgi:tetratricopeptide (TPR) repeat protein